MPDHLELLKKVGRDPHLKPVIQSSVKLLGSGAYGCVASFKDKKTGDKMAVKKITHAFDDLASHLDTFQRAMRWMGSASCARHGS